MLYVHLFGRICECGIAIRDLPQNDTGLLNSLHAAAIVGLLDEIGQSVEPSVTATGRRLIVGQSCQVLGRQATKDIEKDVVPPILSQPCCRALPNSLPESMTVSKICAIVSRIASILSPTFLGMLHSYDRFKYLYFLFIR